MLPLDDEKSRGSIFFDEKQGIILKVHFFFVTLSLKRKESKDGKERR
jgi:hypothetical protein